MISFAMWLAPPIVAFTYLCGLAHAAGKVSEHIKSDWRRQYEAMLAEKGGLRPTDKQWIGLAAVPMRVDRSPVDVVLPTMR